MLRTPSDPIALRCADPMDEEPTRRASTPSIAPMPRLADEGVTIVARVAARATPEDTVQIARAPARTPVVLWVSLGIAVGMLAMLVLLQA